MLSATARAHRAQTTSTGGTFVRLGLSRPYPISLLVADAPYQDHGAIDA